MDSNLQVFSCTKTTRKDDSIMITSTEFRQVCDVSPSDTSRLWQNIPNISTDW